MTIFISIIVLGAAITAWLFRRGGIYNLIEPMPNEAPDASETSANTPTATISNPPIAPVYEPPTASQRLYKVASENLGKHLTLNSTVSPETGCAEACSWILLNAGYPIPQGGIPTVSGLTDWMQQQGFKETTAYAPGNIIVGRSPTDAHVGICGKNMIMSNTSYDIPSLGLHQGKFEANYHLAGWVKTFHSTRYFIPA